MYYCCMGNQTHNFNIFSQECTGKLSVLDFEYMQSLNKYLSETIESLQPEIHHISHDIQGGIHQ